MALFSKQYLEWELVFVASIPSQVDSHCILDAISPALPPDISYTLRTTRFLTDRSNGVRISRPTFLPDTLAHLHYQNVVFLNKRGEISEKHSSWPTRRCTDLARQNSNRAAKVRVLCYMVPCFSQKLLLMLKSFCVLHALFCQVCTNCSAFARCSHSDVPFSHTCCAAGDFKSCRAHSTFKIMYMLKYRVLQ